jgi:hypothetical protein
MVMGYEILSPGRTTWPDRPPVADEIIFVRRRHSDGRRLRSADRREHER